MTRVGRRSGWRELVLLVALVGPPATALPAAPAAGPTATAEGGQLADGHLRGRGGDNAPPLEGRIRKESAEAQQLCAGAVLGQERVAYEVSPHTFQITGIGVRDHHDVVDAAGVNTASSSSSSRCKLLPVAERRAAEKVLAGKHLVFIGDSVTRYQYLSLVYFLEHSSFASPEPENTWEKSFDSWNEFYQVTNSRLNGHEACDCFRDHAPDWADTQFENRYYYNPATGVRITYIGWWGGSGIRFHPATLLAFSAPGGTAAAAAAVCAAGTCSSASYPAFSTSNVLEFARDWLPRLRPHFLVANCGHWGGCGTRDDAAGLLHAALAAGVAAPHRAVWKTTTLTYNRGWQAQQTDVAAEVFREGGACVLDARELTRVYHRVLVDPRAPAAVNDLIWRDNKHFCPVVYEQLNVLLVNMLSEVE